MLKHADPLPASRRAVAGALKKGIVSLAIAVMALLGLSATAAALPVGAGAAANALDVVGFAAGMLAVFLLFFLIGLVALLVAWKGLSMKYRTIGAIVVTALFAMVLLGALQPSMVPPTGDGQGPEYVPKWEIILQTTRSTARDAASEIFDSQGGTGGGGETPTATLCAYGTNAEVDLSNKILRHAVTVDDDVATSAAGFSSPDICSVDFSFRLLNPQDANGDGTMDAVSIFARVRSISATVTEDGNGSSTRRNIFQRDTTFGWYVGWSRDVDTINTDGQWISIAPAGVDDAQLGTSYDWQNLGVNSGLDEDYATFAYILRNYGPFGYTLPVIGYQYTMTVDIGTPADYQTIGVLIFLTARA